MSPNWDQCLGENVNFSVIGNATKPVRQIEVCVEWDGAPFGECTLGPVDYAPGTTSVTYQKSWISKIRTTHHDALIVVFFEDNTWIEVPFFLPAFPQTGAAFMAASANQVAAIESQRQPRGSFFGDLTFVLSGALLVAGIANYGVCFVRNNRKE